PGDKILIGSQELVLLLGKEQSLRETVNFPGRGTLPKIPAVPDSAIPSIQVPPPDPGETAAAKGAELAGEGDSSTVRRVTAFKLLGGVAEKALAMGRADEAERLLSGPLADLLDAT